MTTDARRRAARTAYLPPERTGPLRLAGEIERASRSPVVEALLVGSGAALAILNEDREILALNAAYLALLGVDEPGRVLGQRPGEAVRCVHAAAPGGCGTSPGCPGCGAAIAILVATRRGRPAERDCALRASRGGRDVDLVFRVRAAPLDLWGTPLVLLTLSDVGAERRRSALQRAFLHDLANLATGLSSAAAELGDDDSAEPPLATDIRSMAERLVREVQLQRALASGADGLRAAIERVPVDRCVAALRALAAHLPCGRGRRLEIDVAGAPPALDTDPVLVDHVLANMLVNALEATPRGGTVRLVVRGEGDRVRFRVWNEGVVPKAVRPRVFQRYFTTKGEGRGQGTFAMKLFGETCLGGEVSFTTSPADGTAFELRLPVSPRAARGA